MRELPIHEYANSKGTFSESARALAVLYIVYYILWFSLKAYITTWSWVCRPIGILLLTYAISLIFTSHRPHTCWLLLCEHFCFVSVLLWVIFYLFFFSLFNILVHIVFCSKYSDTLTSYHTWISFSFSFFFFFKFDIPFCYLIRNVRKWTIGLSVESSFSAYALTLKEPTSLVSHRPTADVSEQQRFCAVRICYNDSWRNPWRVSLADLKCARWVTNSVYPDQTPRSGASDLCLHWLFTPVCPNIYGKCGRQVLNFLNAHDERRNVGRRICNQEDRPKLDEEYTKSDRKLCWYWNRNRRNRTFRHMRPTETQISLNICAVWHFASLTIQNTPNEDSDQPAHLRSDQNIRLVHMSERTFSDVAPQLETTGFFINASKASAVCTL